MLFCNKVSVQCTASGRNIQWAKCTTVKRPVGHCLSEKIIQAFVTRANSAMILNRRHLNSSCLCVNAKKTVVLYICVGGFAFVFVAQDLKDGKEYALKVCSQLICVMMIHMTLRYHVSFFNI